jgi:hypothetical protein
VGVFEPPDLLTVELVRAPEIDLPDAMASNPGGGGSRGHTVFIGICALEVKGLVSLRSWRCPPGPAVLDLLGRGARAADIKLPPFQLP